MNISTMRGLVRRDLKDEVAESYRWTNDDIDRAIARAVAEFSLYAPRPMKNTIATTDDSRDIDISALADRISVDQVEFPLDEHPRIFQRFTVYQDTLTLIGAYEGDGEDCDILWTKVHTLDADSSSIPTRYEYLIALAACFYALETYSDHTLVEQVQTALESAATALGNVAGQITDAETALTSAAGVDSDIATEITAAKAEIAKAAAAIATAIATGAGTIDDDVDTALTAAATRITAAVSSIGDADTPLGSIAARLTAAIASLASGDDYMNTANIGGDVAASWADYARADVDISQGYNREADGYLSQAEQDLSGALRQLGIAEETAKKKDANIGAGDGYVRTATGYLGTARELNNKRLAYLTAADRYIETTQAYITQANQHNQSAAQYTSLSKSLAIQAKTKRAELQREFKAILTAKGVKLTTLYTE